MKERCSLSLLNEFITRKYNNLVPIAPTCSRFYLLMIPEGMPVSLYSLIVFFLKDDGFFERKERRKKEHYIYL